MCKEPNFYLNETNYNILLRSDYLPTKYRKKRIAITNKQGKIVFYVDDFKRHKKLMSKFEDV